MEFQQMLPGTTRCLHAKEKRNKTKQNKTSILYLEKTNSKWIIDLNVKYKTFKKKNRRTSCSLKLGNGAYI